MIRIIVAKVRRVRAFLNWDNKMIRFRSGANLGPISKVGRGAKRGVSLVKVTLVRVVGSFD
jgi:hypothetical protein